MSESRLNEIKERYEKATTGHWKVYEKDEGTMIGTINHHAQLKGPAPVVVLGHWAEAPHKRVHINENDAAFIAHSKEDVEWLIQQVENLQEKLRVDKQDVSVAPSKMPRPSFTRRTENTVAKT